MNNNNNNNQAGSKTARNRARRQRRARAKQQARANQNQNQPQPQQPQPQLQPQPQPQPQNPVNNNRNNRNKPQSYNNNLAARGGSAQRGRGIARGRAGHSAWRGRGRGRGRARNYNKSSARSYNSSRNSNTNTNTKQNKNKPHKPQKTTNDPNDTKKPLKFTDEGKSDMKQNEMNEEHEQKVSHLNIQQLQTLFLGENKINDHINALHNNREKYLLQLQLFIKYGVITKVSTSTKAKILCALLIRNERSTVEWLMSHQRYYSVGEIAKCIQYLDAPRKARQYHRKLDKLLAIKKKNNKAVKDKTISSLRTKIHNLELDPHSGSLNGAKCRLFKKWIESVPKERLEFFLLNFGTTNWKLICDLIHPSPKKHFQCKYFQDAVFENKNDDKVIDANNGKLPKKSLVYQAKRANKGNIVSLLQKYPYLSECYSYLRKQLLTLDENKNNQNNQNNNRNRNRNNNRNYNQYRGGFGGAINNDSSLEGIELKIKSLISLGFSRHESLCGLSRNGLNIEGAAEWLFDENNKNSCLNVLEKSYYQYDYVKQMDGAIPAEAKHILAENAPLEDVLWWYDELHSAEVEMEVMQRLKESYDAKQNIFTDDSARSNYGKLMERILLFREKKYKFVPYLTQHAQLRLESVKFDELNNKNSFIRCAVLGDASGSMEVAIKSSCIIASLLSVALSADLKFFNSDVFDPPVIPRNVAQTIQVVNKISARGGTCMAAAIYPYLMKKIKIDLFILVSDEGENEKYDGQYFTSLFKTYRNNINPKAQLFLVSFLKVGEEGTIMQRLKQKNIDINSCVKQFRLHPENPDTSKFNALLGMVALLLSAMKEHFYVIADILMKSESFHKHDAHTIANIICSYL